MENNKITKLTLLLKKRLREIFTLKKQVFNLDNNVIVTRKSQVYKIERIAFNLLKSVNYFELSDGFDIGEFVSLENVYVDLILKTKQKVKGIESIQNQLESRVESINLNNSSDEFITTHDFLHELQYQNQIILGPSGCGKSTLLLFICNNILNGLSANFFIPVLISLPSFVNQKNINPNLDLLDYAIKTTFDNEIDKEFLSICSLNSENILFLFDGYDEISHDKELRDIAVDEINKLYPDYKWILVSTESGYFELCCMNPFFSSL